MQQITNIPTAWTIAETKAKLSKILRLANEEPQYIGTKKSYVIVTAKQWEKVSAPAEPMGQWLVKNLAELGELKLPDRKDLPREIPFQ